MNDIELTQNNLIELMPDYLEDFNVPQCYMKYPWEIIPSLGTACDSFSAAFQNAVHGAGGSGIYKVDVPNGGKMFAAKDGTGYIGSTANVDGTVGGGQARLNPIQVDVGQLCTAVTLATIQIQLADIKEQQQAILDYLHVKDEAQLLGHMNFLIKTLDGYKLNWNNEDFKRSRQNEIVHILADAEGSVKQYKRLVDVATRNKKFVHINKNVEKELNGLLQAFTDYKMAISLFAFASYMDVLTHETYSEEYLNGIVKGINDYVLDYRLKYTDCYNQLEQYAKSSLESYVAKGLSAAQFAVGKVAVKVPLVNKTSADLKLQEGGEFVEKVDKSRVDDIMKSFVQCQIKGENVFVNQINTMNMLHNHPMTMVFDKEGFYISDALNS